MSLCLYLVPCNALASGRWCAEDRGEAAVHAGLTGQTGEAAMWLHLAMGAVLGGPGATDAGDAYPRGLARAATTIDREAGPMRIHLAERDPQHHGWPSRGAQVADPPLRLRILLSYWYYKDTDLDALFAKYFTPPYPEVFADSGAFSAMTQGAPLHVDDYAAWVKRWRHLFVTYANLDVIRDAAGTWRHQRILEDRHGLAPLPVFHVAEDWRWLDRYLARYPYIALGVAGHPHQTYLPWLVACFKRARMDRVTARRLDAPRAVFHGFGITSWEALKAFPWYSVDSSSWGSGFRYGRVPIFDGRAGRFVNLPLGDHAAWYAAAPQVRALGFDPADFVDRARYDRAKVCALSALSYMRAEAWLRARHGPVTIPSHPGAPAGPRTHLADANPARFGEAARGVRVHLADTSNGVNYGRADAGLKTYCADARGHNGGEIAAIQAGLTLYLAEHSLDRGG